jgi:hypothetical protein
MRQKDVSHVGLPLEIEMLATLPHRIRVATAAMCVLSISPSALAATCPVSACSAPYCSVENDPIPDPSKDLPGFPAPFRSEKLNGAGPYMNAYAVNGVATRCTNGTPAITRLWWHNIDFARYQSSGAPELPILAPGEAMTWKFTAPASGISAFTYDRGGDGIFTPAFISLSQTPCDFDVTKVRLAGKQFAFIRFCSTRRGMPRRVLQNRMNANCFPAKRTSSICACRMQGPPAWAASRQSTPAPRSARRHAVERCRFDNASRIAKIARCQSLVIPNGFS